MTPLTAYDLKVMYVTETALFHVLFSIVDGVTKNMFCTSERLCTFNGMYSVIRL